LKVVGISVKKYNYAIVIFMVAPTLLVIIW